MHVVSLPGNAHKYTCVKGSGKCGSKIGTWKGGHPKTNMDIQRHVWKGIFPSPHRK